MAGRRGAGRTARKAGARSAARPLGGRTAPGPPPKVGVPRATPPRASASSTDPKASAAAGPKVSLPPCRPSAQTSAGQGTFEGHGRRIATAAEKALRHAGSAAA